MSAKVIPNSERWFDLTDLPEEEWRDIEGYDGLYQISNYGRVKSLARAIGTGISKRDSKVTILKNNLVRKVYDSNGKLLNNYVRVSLTKYGKKRKCVHVHRLVARAFIPNPENKPTVDHWDEDKTNNHVSNLSWMTYKEQMNKGTCIERAADAMSKSVGQYTLSGEIVQIWKSIAETRRNGYEGVSQCCLGKYCQACGYQWRFIDDDGQPTFPLINKMTNRFERTAKVLSKPVFQYTLDGTFVKAWKSAPFAVRSNNKYTQSGICMCCSGKIKIYKGFQWRYVNEDFTPTIPLILNVIDIPIKSLNNKPRRIGKFSGNTLEKIYDSVSDVTNDCFSSGNVCECCKGKRQSHKGFKWRYLDDDGNPTIPL